MNKARVELQKRLLWIYLRHQRRCSVCGQEVGPGEATTDRAVSATLGIDELLRVNLLHSRCKAVEMPLNRWLAA